MPTAPPAAALPAAWSPADLPTSPPGSPARWCSGSRSTEPDVREEAGKAMRLRPPLPRLSMRKTTRLFGATLLALATAFAAPAPARAGDAVAPRHHTISNVATIEWDVGGERLSLASNQV